MNNIKKIVYVVALFTSCIPVPSVALPNNKSVVPSSKFHGGHGNGVSTSPMPYHPGNPKMAPYVFQPSKFTEQVSSTWSAIPIEIKVASGFFAFFGITSAYYRLKRWWYSTDSKANLLDKKLNQSPDSPRVRSRSVSGDSSSSGGSIPSLESERRSSNDSSSSSLSSDGQQSYSQSLSDQFYGVDDEKEPEGVFVPYEKVEKKSDPDPVVSSDEEKDSVFTSWFSRLASWVSSFKIGSGDTPGNVLLERPSRPKFEPKNKNEDVCYKSVEALLREEMEQGVIKGEWLQSLIPTMVHQIESTYQQPESDFWGSFSSQAVDISTFQPDVLRSIVRDMVNGASWFKEFRCRRNRAKLEYFKARVSSDVQDSTFSVLSKADAVFAGSVGEGDNQLAIVRIAVPEQKSAECGPWSLVNLSVMDQAIRCPSGVGLPGFYGRSRAYFDRHFTHGPEDQNMLPDALMKKAQEIRFHNYILVNVSDRLGSVFPDKYWDPSSDKAELCNVSDYIRKNLSQKIPANILLCTQSECADRQHCEHWSAVSIVYTDSMKWPVTFLMDSLKNDAEFATKKIVEDSLRVIKNKVADIMKNQSSVDEPSPALSSGSGDDAVGLE